MSTPIVPLALVSSPLQDLDYEAPKHTPKGTLVYLRPRLVLSYVLPSLDFASTDTRSTGCRMTQLYQ
ncbi:hypothetical protein FA13DRAFT_1739539 [Coprinellus micaceus]|uniref:Uncharacterized protein n=1 Tax=Coprinellus micaceus TaxID=71717 RepID=A0A4Y7SQ91_COPMI|nr:hypothetical protein FA13DRAFT_1739539 [Coprinellus micaceus]